MVKDAVKRSWKSALIGLAVLATAQAAFAGFYFLFTEGFIDGVDENGLLSTDNGSPAPCFVFKSTNSGLIIQACQGVVINDSGTGQTYRNFGSEVYDPQTQEDEVALIDILRVGPTGRARQLGIAINHVP